MLLSALALSFVAFGLAAWLTSRFVRPDSRFHILDHPNERSLHTRPTPRTGGIAIVTALMVVGSVAAIFFATEWQRLGYLAVAVLLVAVTSFVDDRRGLASGYRMIAHLIAAAVLVVGGFSLEALTFEGGSFVLVSVSATVASILCIAWMINLYNFMDGMDGFAGGMAVLGFGVFAAFGAWHGQWLFATLNLIVSAGAAGFLLFNFPPARIFMGDAGSSTLGLLAAAFSLWGARDDVFPFWIAALVFSPFIVDATVTLLRRLCRREKIWLAHKTHYYQRLVQAGWTHRKTVQCEYVLMLACAISAFLAAPQSTTVQRWVAAAWIVIYCLLALLVTRLERRLVGVKARRCQV